MKKQPLTDNAIRVPKTFTPIGNKLAVQVIRQDTTEGGIVLPDNLRNESIPEAICARVVAAGPECKQVKVGDKIIVPPKLAGDIVKYAGHNYIIIPEDKIHGTID